MDLATLAPWFQIATFAVLPGWILLVVAPGWKPGTRLVAPVLLPALIALGYIALLALGNFGIFFGGTGPAGGGFSSLEGVMILFTSPIAVLGGWLHYLAFDLVVGAWQVRDAQARGLPHALVVPCLILTFLLGPVGYLCYLTLRFATRRVLAAD